MNYKSFRIYLQHVMDMNFEDIKEAIQYAHSDNNYTDFYLGGDGDKYRFIHEDVIDDIYYYEVVEQIKDGYGLNVPDFVEIDWDKTVENCMYDGYGHHFSHYDGSEHESEGYYIFRLN